MKSANLLKSLKFNTLIYGESGTGRHTLANLILPDAPVIHGNDTEYLLSQIEKQDALVIDLVEQIRHPGKVLAALKKENTRAVMIAQEEPDEVLERFFSVKIYLPPLRERPEDVAALAERFKEETLRMFGAQEGFTLDAKRFDLSANAHSLRRSVVFQYLKKAVSEEELMEMTERLLAERMGEEEDLYRKMLYLYEVPLIRAGTARYGSQLKMSKVFGLNRNTLRKKIREWARFLEP